MKKYIYKPKLNLLTLAIMAASGGATTAYAEGAIEEVISTGVFKAAGQNKLDSSVSVSSVNLSAITEKAPTNMAEIYQSLPGIRSEASSGGGNSNVAIRGLPLSTGGAKFLQQHEDGLPVLLIGDFDFAPPDGFLKADASLGRVESVRGGTASTLTTNGPGGIINIIGKTGDEDGGSLTLKYGLDHDDMRIDVENGGRISDDTYYHIGGHFQQGGDYRDQGYDPISGGQVRLSVTKEYDQGYVRIIGKIIDKKDGVFFAGPSRLEGNEVGEGVRGFDLQSDTIAGPYNRFGRDVDGENTVRDYDHADGFYSKVRAIGAEINFEFENGVTLNNKVRHQSISGDFNGLFMHNVDGFENRFGTSSGATIFNGPNAGMAVSDASLTSLTGNNLVTEVSYFHTNLDDIGNFANELRLSKSFDLDNGSTLDVVLGHFFMNQNFKQDWHWSSFLITTQPQAALIEVPGTTTDGILGFNNAFGWDGSNRNYDVEYQTNSPFAAVSWSSDRLTFDASVRYDEFTQTGVRTEAVGQPVDVNADGVIGPAEMNVSLNTGQVGAESNFEVDNTAWSVGANFRVTDIFAVFGRVSSGASFNAERQMGNFTGPGGILLPGGDDTYVDVVDQYEVGGKWKDIEIGGDGILDFYATVFYAETEESNTNLTAGGTPLVINNEYESFGIELEGKFSIGNFDLNGSATWTDAEITDSESAPATVGNTPQRQADFIWSLSPSYNFGEKARVGLTWLGTTDSYANFENVLEQPGYSVVHAFVSYTFSDNLSFSLNANNLFDEVGITESQNDGRAFDTDGDGEIDHTIARSIAGTSVSASVRLTF